MKVRDSLTEICRNSKFEFGLKLAAGSHWIYVNERS